MGVESGGVDNYHAHLRVRTAPDMAKNEIHGLTLRAGEIWITSLEQKQERWESLGSRSIPWTSEETIPAWTQVSETLRAEGLKGPCTVGLSSSKLLLRVEEFPSTDPDELAGMVELQIDKFSPFPIEQMEVSYEALAQSGTSTRVLIAAAQREQVEDVGGALRAIGLVPQRLDLQVLGWWRVLMDADRIRHGGREVVLILDLETTLLLVHQDGVPEMIRSLESIDEIGAEGFSDVLAEEVDYALTSLEAQWGGEATPSFSVWHAGEMPNDLVPKLTELSDGAEPGVNELATLPPVTEGLGSRATDGVGGRVNLAPPAWEMAAQASIVRRNLMLATAVLLLLWLATVTGFLVALSGRRADLAKRRAYLASLEAPAAAVREAKDKTAFLNLYTDLQQSGLEALRAVSLAMPEGVDLSSFGFARGGTVSLRGTGISPPPIFKFNQALQDLPFFSEVKLDKVDQDRRSGKSLFRITATLAEEPQ